MPRPYRAGATCRLCPSGVWPALEDVWAAGIPDSGQRGFAGRALRPREAKSCRQGIRCTYDGDQIADQDQPNGWLGVRAMD
jgi:hypothetical protein